MPDFALILLVALCPALGNFAGGVLAEVVPVPPRHLNWALHAAAGVVLAIVAVEIVPRGMREASPLVVAGTVTLGGLAYLGLQLAVERIQRSRDSRGGRTGMWMVYIAVWTDLLSDGLMIGAGGAVDAKLAFVLAAGQVLADLPEGFAAIANFRDKGLPQARRLWLSASFCIPALLGASVAYLLLQDLSTTAKMGALVFTGGMLLVAAVEDILEEAHEAAEDSRGSVLALIGGFALFILVSAGLASVVR